MKISKGFWAKRNLVSRYVVGSGIPENQSYASTCKSHRLMLQAQLIAPSASGAFNILPFGMRCLNKLTAIIDKEMSNIGCQKVSMSCLSSASWWKTSGRWDSFGDELVRLKLSGVDHCLNPTHEEAITSMVAMLGSVPLYNLPLKLYQISTKFRDELRPRFGLLRCREFLMKDLYSFDLNIEQAKQTYEEVCEAYESIFTSLNLNYIKAKSSCGNMGGETSNEYLIPSEIGEDKVYLGKDGLAWNAEYEESDISRFEATNTNAIEIGHTFLLGDHYSKLFGARFVQPSGKRATLQMGCYGIGVTRLLASCIEALSTENGIIWPNSIAPFKVCIIPPKHGSKEQKHVGDIEMALYSDLIKTPCFDGEVIIDDRISRTIGKRMRDAKVIGYPVVIIIGKDILNENPTVEVHFQKSGKVSKLPASEILQAISQEFE